MNHSTIDSFETVSGQLCVGGVPLSRLTERVGSTPYFAYDRELLTARVAAVRAALPRVIDLKYAIKANPMPAVVQHLSGLVDSLDVASALEMRTALDTPLPAEKISFAGPGKTMTEISQAVAAGVTIEVESVTELGRVNDAGMRLGLRPRVAIRVNPDFTIKGSGMRMGGGPQQFGVDVEQVPDLLHKSRDLDVDFIGFHVFAGSQNLSAEILGEAQRRTATLLVGLADRCGQDFTYLNLGGGFGIPYFAKDRPLDLDAVGANLSDLMREVITPRFPKANVIIELGRYLVGECGIYVTRVVDKKVSRGKTYLVVDGGMHHQLAASGNFGQVIRRNYPVAVGHRMNESDSEAVTIVGCLCTPLDLLADNVSLPPAHIGDLIVLFQAGAYGLTASPTAFLGHSSPAEVLL